MADRDRTTAPPDGKPAPFQLPSATVAFAFHPLGFNEPICTFQGGVDVRKAVELIQCCLGVAAGMLEEVPDHGMSYSSAYACRTMVALSLAAIAAARFEV